MKKCILFILCLIGTIAYGQNTFKYELRANGGLRVGGSTFAEIDSITLQAGKLRIMTGATLQKIAGHVLYTDTAAMLANYALTSELGEAGIGISDVRNEIADSLNNYVALSDTLTTNTRIEGLMVGYKESDAISMRNAHAISIINSPGIMSQPNLLMDQSYYGTGFIGIKDSIIAISLGQMYPSVKFSVERNFNKSNVLLTTKASSNTTGAGFRLPHGVAPITPVNGDLWTTSNGLFVRINESTDTLATQAYARQFGGTGTVTISDVQGEIADSLINYVAAKDSTGIKSGSYVTGYTFQQGMMNKISVSDTAAMLAPYALLSEIGTGGDISILKMRVDSIVDVLKDSVNVETLLNVNLSTDTLSTKAYARSVGGGGGSAGITLNSGTLTLTGDAGTADDITFYTNGNGEYNLPTGGGNLTIQSQVQAWINDTADVVRNSLPYSYVIDTISGFVTATAKSGSGLTSYSGASAATVINHAIAALTNGGDIYFRNKNYTITTSIVDGGNSDINLIFERGASLTAGDDLNLPVIYLTSVSRWRVKGIEIDGNRANQTPPNESGVPETDGFWSHGCNDIIVSDAYIHDCGRFGANFDYSSTYSGIENSMITLCDWNGVNLGNLYTDIGLFAVNNEVSHCSDVGITTYGTSCRIIGNYIHHMDGTTGYINSQWAIGCEGSDGTIGNNIISQNRIVSTGTAIVVVSGRPGNIITDNMITDISLSSYSGAIIIYSVNNTIKGNRIVSTDADVVGLWLEGNNNLVQGNTFVTVRGIRTADNCDNSFISGNWFQCSTVAILVAYATNNNTRIIGNDFDASADDLDDSGTGTIIGDNIKKNGILADILPIFVFGAGGGMPTDTATFQNGVIAGAFYNSGSNNLKITSLRGVLAEGTGTETIDVQISWHATFKSASAVNLNASPLTITSITTGDEDTSFANDEIPPGVWVWCTLSGASANNKPTLLSLTMSGYKIPIY